MLIPVEGHTSLRTVHLVRTAVNLGVDLRSFNEANGRYGDRIDSHVRPNVGNEVSGVAACHHLAGENAEGIPALKKRLEVMLCWVSGARGRFT